MSKQDPYSSVAFSPIFVNVTMPQRQRQRRARTRGPIARQGPHQVAEKSTTTNFPSLEALRMAASTSAKVSGSATAPPRTKRDGVRLEIPNTEGIKEVEEDVKLVGARLERLLAVCLAGADTGTAAILPVVPHRKRQNAEKDRIEIMARKFVSKRRLSGFGNVWQSRFYLECFHYQ